MKETIQNMFGKTTVFFCVLLVVNSFPLPHSTLYTRFDVIPPVITINFAGNLSDRGGPAHRMGDPNHMLPNGYYSNDSRQTEDWIYINVSVNGTGSDPNSVRLHWCQRSGQTFTWDNSTWSFVRTGPTGKPNTFYYEFNSKGNIPIPGDGTWYSFDVWADDQGERSTIQRWEKNGLLFSVTRRFVQLGCTPVNISYTPFYVWDYTSGSGVYGMGDYNQPDDLHHDQGGAFNANDTGYINSTMPGDVLQFRRCGAFVGLWFEDTVCIQPLKLKNVYFHFWWSSQGGTTDKIGWKKNRLTPGTLFDAFYIADATVSRSELFVDNHEVNYSDNYHLSTHLLNTPIVLDDNFTENDIYELCIQLAFSYVFPNVIDNQSILSFIVLNVPDNTTLASMDSDHDQLNDFVELYETYTSPFISDTDHDGCSDYNEQISHTDPNNYTDYPHSVYLQSFPFYPSLINTGASVMQMTMDYLMWNSTQSPDGPPEGFKNESYFNTTYSNGDFIINGSELCHGLNSEIDDQHQTPPYIYGYFYNSFARTTSYDALKDAVIWLDYNVSGSNQGRDIPVPKPGHPYHTPVAVPTGGNYSHWMIIKGMNTNRSLWDTTIPGHHSLIPGDVNIYGFWVDDPSSNGLGDNTYVTYQYFNDTYFKKLNVPGDSYHNTFLVIDDPPQDRPLVDTSGITLKIGKSTGFSPAETNLVLVAQKNTAFQLRANNIVTEKACVFIDSVLKNNPSYSPLIIGLKNTGKVTYQGPHILVTLQNTQLQILVQLSLSGEPELFTIQSTNIIL
jgi:hypothetical protein